MGGGSKIKPENKDVSQPAAQAQGFDFNFGNGIFGDFFTDYYKNALQSNSFPFQGVVTDPWRAEIHTKPDRKSTLAHPQGLRGYKQPGGGLEVKVLSEENGWYKVYALINLKLVTGFVSKNLIKPVSASPSKDEFAPYYQPLENDFDTPIDLKPYREQVQKAKADKYDDQARSLYDPLVHVRDGDINLAAGVYPGGVRITPPEIEATKSLEKAISHNKKVAISDVFKNLSSYDIDKFTDMPDEWRDGNIPASVWLGIDVSIPTTFDIQEKDKSFVFLIDWDDTVMINTRTTGWKAQKWIANKAGEEEISKEEFYDVQRHYQDLYLQKESEIIYNKMINEIKENNFSSKLEIKSYLNKQFKKFSTQYLNEDEIKLRDINIEISECIQRAESFKIDKTQDPDQTKYQAEWKKIGSLIDKRCQLEFEIDNGGRQRYRWFDLNGNIINKEKKIGDEKNEAVQQQLNYLQALLSDNDYERLLAEFFSVYFEVEAANKIKGNISNYISLPNQGGAANVDVNQNFKEKSNSLNNRAKALAIFLSTQQDPSTIEHDILGSLWEGLVESVTGNERTIVSNRQKVQDLYPSLVKTGLARKQDWERAYESGPDSIAYTVGGVLENIVEFALIEMVTMGLGIELALANALSKMKALAAASKYSKFTVKAIEKLEIATPYIVEELKFGFSGEGIGAGSAELGTEKLLDKLLHKFLSKNFGTLGNILIKTPIKAAASTAQETMGSIVSGDIDISNLSQQDKEELVFTYAMGLVFGLIDSGNIKNKEKLESEIGKIHSDDPMVLEAKDIIKNYSPGMVTDINLKRKTEFENTLDNRSKLGLDDLIKSDGFDPIAAKKAYGTNTSHGQNIKMREDWLNGWRPSYLRPEIKNMEVIQKFPPRTIEKIPPSIEPPEIRPPLGPTGFGRDNNGKHNNNFKENKDIKLKEIQGSSFGKNGKHQKLNNKRLTFEKDIDALVKSNEITVEEAQALRDYNRAAPYKVLDVQDALQRLRAGYKYVPKNKRKGGWETSGKRKPPPPTLPDPIPFSIEHHLNNLDDEQLQALADSLQSLNSEASQRFDLNKNTNLIKEKEKKKKGNTNRRKALIERLTDHKKFKSRNIGEIASEIYVKIKYGALIKERLFPIDLDNKKIHEFESHSGVFDQVYQLTDGRIIVIEAKGGKGTETGRWIDGSTYAYQGTPEYFESIKKSMEGKGHSELVKKIEEAQSMDKIEYIKIQQKLNEKNNSLNVIEITSYPLK